MSDVDEPSQMTRDEPRPAQDALALGDFVLDPESGVLSGPGGETRLRPQTLLLLQVLSEAAPRVVDRHELLDRVWGVDHVSPSSLKQAISELRSALDDSAKEPRYIETLPRRGYRWVASVVPLAQEPQLLSKPEPERESEPESPVAEMANPGRRWPALAVAPAVLVLVLVGWWIYQSRGDGSQDAPGPGSQPSSNPEVLRWQAEAARALREHDFVPARDKFREALVKAPNDPSLLAGLAAALDRLGLDQQALVEAERAVELSANHSLSIQRLTEGRFHSLRRDWPEAVQSFEALTRLQPADPEAGFELLLSQIRAGQIGAAEKTLESMVDRHPDVKGDPRLDLARSDIFIKRGAFGDALATAQRAGHLAAAHGWPMLLAAARLLQAEAHHRVGELELALTAAREASQAYQAADQPFAAARARQLEGSIRLSLKDFDEAETAFNEALAAFDSLGVARFSARTLNNLAVLASRRGDLDGAVDFLDRSLQLKRQAGDLLGLAGGLNNLAEITRHLGQTERARQHLDEVLAVNEQLNNRSIGARARWIYGRLHRETGALDQAEIFYRQAIELFLEAGETPTAVQVSCDRLDLLLRLGHLEEVESAYQGLSSLLRSQETPDARANSVFCELAMGQAELHRGQLEAAGKRFQSFVEDDAQSGGFEAILARNGVVRVALEAGELPVAAQRLKELEQALEGVTDWFPLGLAALSRIELVFAQGEVAEAEAAAQDLLDGIGTEAPSDIRTLGWIQLAKAQAVVGKCVEARQNLSRAEADLDTRLFDVALVWHLESAIAEAKCGNPGRAEGLFSLGLDLARQRGYRSLEQKFLRARDGIRASDGPPEATESG